MAEPANPSHACATVLVDELARCGVAHAVLAPGSRSTALAMALHDDERIRLHVQVDERSAGFLAIGLGRATGRPAVVVTTSGGATTHLHPAVVEADTGGVPLLLLTADRPPELRHTGANQTIDQLKLFGNAVRWFCELGVPEDHAGANAHWRSTIDRAVAEADGLGSPPGPVHVNVAFREPTVPATDDGRTAARGPFTSSTDGRPNGAPWTAVVTGSPRAEPHRVHALADRLAGARRGLVVVGDEAGDPVGVHELAARLGWPVVAEPHSGARTLDAIAHAAPLLAVEPFLEEHRPDLVLRVGRPTVSRAVLGLLEQVPQVAVSHDGAWHDPGRGAGELVVADVGHLCRDLADHLDGDGTEDGWRDAWDAADRQAEDAIGEVLDAAGEVTEPATARAAQAAVLDDGALVVGSSMPIRDLDAWAPTRDGIRIVANRGGSGIDGFVSTAVGVALGSQAPTVALGGDLSLLHDSNGLLARPDGGRPDLVLVVVDNDGGGIFHFLPQADYPDSFERIFGTPHGLDLRELARAHGLDVGSPTAGQLQAEINERATLGGQHLVHVRTDRQANVDLHRRLQQAVADALS